MRGGHAFQRGRLNIGSVKILGQKLIGIPNHYIKTPKKRVLNIIGIFKAIQHRNDPKKNFRRTAFNLLCGFRPHNFAIHFYNVVHGEKTHRYCI